MGILARAHAPAIVREDDGWRVVTQAGQTELSWGPYPTRPLAVAQQETIRHAIAEERAIIRPPGRGARSRRIPRSDSGELWEHRDLYELWATAGLGRGVYRRLVPYLSNVPGPGLLARARFRQGINRESR